jgi:hypothetical protein
MEGVIEMYSAAEFTRPGSSDSGMRLIKRVSGRDSGLKYTEQMLEDGQC